jgi:hypothetical protein
MTKKISGLTPKDKEKIKKRDGNMCLKCGRRDNLHVHHIVELYQGGTDGPTNLSTLCSSCHQEWHGLIERSKIPYEEWLKCPCTLLLINLFRTMEELVDKGDDIPISKALDIVKKSQELLKNVPLF